MRFGVWAAAAAATLCASEAQAVTYVLFEAQGTGTVVTCCSSYPPPTKTGDLFFDFVVEVDPGYSDGQDYGTGSYFKRVSGADNYSVGIANGTISLNYSNFPSQYGSAASATINLTPSGAQTFLNIPSYTAASGTVSYGYASPFGGPTITGTVSRLVTLGVVSQYFAPYATVLPEPATWAMMILGAAAVGYSLRRRRISDVGLPSPQLG